MSEKLSKFDLLPKAPEPQAAKGLINPPCTSERFNTLSRQVAEWVAKQQNNPENVSSDKRMAPELEAFLLA